MTFNILKPEEETLAQQYNGIPAQQLLIKVFAACGYDESVLSQLDFETPSGRPDTVCCITRTNGYAIYECRFVDRKGPAVNIREYEDAYHFLYALHIILPNYILHPFEPAREPD